MSWQKFCKENTKAITIKGKKCTLNSIKIKTFCSSKDIIKKIKNQATVREKIFAAHIYDKGLIYRICKEVLHFNNQKKTYFLKREKFATDYTKEDTQMTNKYLKRYSTLLVISKVQKKKKQDTTRMAKTTKTKTQNIKHW